MRQHEGIDGRDGDGQRQRQRQSATTTGQMGKIAGVVLAMGDGVESMLGQVTEGMPRQTPNGVARRGLVGDRSKCNLLCQLDKLRRDGAWVMRETSQASVSR